MSVYRLRVVAATSISTGAMYGYIFGVLDIQDQLAKSPDALRQALHSEAKICCTQRASRSGAPKRGL